MSFEALKQRFMIIRSQYYDTVKPFVKMARFFTDLRKKGDDEAVIDLCLWILETATGTNAYWEIQNAGKELERRRATKALGHMKALRTTRPEIGGTLDIHIAALEALRDGTACVCEVYAAKAADYGPSMTVSEQHADKDEWKQETLCTCNICGKKWRVTSHTNDRGSTVYTWQEVE